MQLELIDPNFSNAVMHISGDTNNSEGSLIQFSVWLVLA
jgi:hypothetical protein